MPSPGPQPPGPHPPGPKPPGPQPPIPGPVPQPPGPGPYTPSPTIPPIYTIDLLKGFFKFLTGSDESCEKQLPPVDQGLVNKMNEYVWGIPFDITIPLSPTHFPDENQIIFLVISAMALERILSEHNYNIPTCIVGTLGTIIKTPPCKYASDIGVIGLAVFHTLLALALVWKIKLSPCIEAWRCIISECIDQKSVTCDTSKCSWFDK